jgi:c-di-GMP-binding flagellar brake protein YcgR
MSEPQRQSIDREKVIGRILKVNTLVTLKIPEGINAGTYPSRVEDLSPSDFTVSGPSYKDIPVLLSPGSSVSIQILCESGICEFNSEVHTAQRDPIYLVSMNLPEDYYMVQRRAFVRLDCRVPVQYQVVGVARTPGERPPRLETVSKNISGNGICLLLDNPFEPETRLDLYLNLFPEHPPIYIMGQVIRCLDATRDGGRKTFEAGIAFVQIRQLDQDRIVKYVFDKQRKAVRLDS